MMLIISASHLKVPLPAFTKEKHFSLFFFFLFWMALILMLLYFSKLHPLHLAKRFTSKTEGNYKHTN